MAKKFVRSGNAELCVQSFGERSDPPVLLIMGMMASMLWWPESFCEQLAKAGRFVVRYDNRDTGRSTNFPLGAPGYSASDMADDAIAVLDGHGIQSAHIVGMSMGGMIAQLVALRHASRVRTLTVMSTSPLGVSELPPMTAAYAAHSASGETLDWWDTSATRNSCCAKQKFWQANAISTMQPPLAI